MIDGWWFAQDDATDDVEVTRTILHIWQGVPGKASECMNAKCVMSHARNFPHRVLGVLVLKTIVLVTDKLPVLDEKGKQIEDGHVIRYMLDGGARWDIKNFDVTGTGRPGKLILKAPRGREALGSNHDRQNSGGHGSTGANRKVFARGEKARILQAAAAASQR